MPSKSDSKPFPVFRSLSAIATIGLLSCLCEFYTTRMQALDMALLHSSFGSLDQISLRLAGESNAATAVFVDPLFQFPLIVAVTAAATVVGRTLPLVGRVFGSVQIMAMTLVVQSILYRCFNAETSLTALTLATFMGCGAGYLIRLSAVKRENAEIQLYDLLRRKQELEEAKILLIKQDEIERGMLAADLHDQVLNDLQMLRVGIRELHTKCDAKSIQYLEAQVGKTMDDIRDIMESLSPSALEHLGLLPAIEDCVRSSADKGDFSCRIRRNISEETALPFSNVTQSLLYRLVQESMTNVRKHAAASMVKATFGVERGEFIVRIMDDGKGIRGTFTRIESRGMRYMKLRADLIGARVSWGHGDDGNGTCVEIRMGLEMKYDHTRTYS